MALNTVEELVQAIRSGNMVILLDDEGRENEGDLVMAAECVDAKAINFMATHARGLICLTLTEQRCQQLNLSLMVEEGGNVSRFGTHFTRSIEAAHGVTTGISAADRAQTIRTAVARHAKPKDIVQPGHIFPIMAQPGGVLIRAGHTEAGCDLARLAGYEPAAVIVEIMNENGSMARRSELEHFAKRHGLCMGTIADLIHYRVAHERTIESLQQGVVSTDFGEFMLHVYQDLLAGNIHFALVKGAIDRQTPTLVRVHVASTLRDVLMTQVMDRLSWNAYRCLQTIAEQGQGVFVLLSSDLPSKADILNDVSVALKHQSQTDTTSTENDGHPYLTVGLGSQILRDLGVRKMRLMGAPIKYNAISGFGLKVVEYVSPTL